MWSQVKPCCEETKLHGRVLTLEPLASNQTQVHRKRGKLKKETTSGWKKKRNAIPTDYQPSSKCGKCIHNVEKPSGADLSRTLARQLFESFVARDPSSKIWQNIRPTLDPATRISTEMCSKGPSTSSTSNIWTPSPSIWSNDLGILRPDPSHHSSDLAAGRNICHPSFFPHLEVS